MNALIFDVDGTLADTEDVHRQCFNAAFARAGLDWHWSRPLYRDLLKVAGGKERIGAHIARLGLRDAQRSALRESIAEIHAEKTRLYGRAVAAGEVPLREGVARLLNEALEAGWQLAIASTTTAANVDALLQTTLGPHALEMFSAIACGDVVSEKKPAPDIYQLVLRTLAIAPEDAVAVEDSVNGLRAATAAGLWTVVTPTYWTEGGDFSQAALVLPHLGELTMDRLIELRAPPRPFDPLRALYQGAW
jgi:HAD superfamily hydrolase (TIGR01509 family)